MGQEIKPLPKNKQEAFVESSLYEVFDLSEWEEEALIDFFMGGGTIDAWCPICDKQSVYHLKSKQPGLLATESRKKLSYTETINLEAVCSRGGIETYNGCNSILSIIFKKDGNKVIKIGQYPSIADLDFGSLDSAFKELEKDHRKELGTAVGLYSHGVGIGSFVYLRRIFESLVENAHQEAAKQNGWDDAIYNKSRMVEKIKLLSGFLPNRIVKSASIYAILSKGIHELSENECKKKFPIVRQAIQLILKEKHEDKEYEMIVRSLNNNN